MRHIQQFEWCIEHLMMDLREQDCRASLRHRYDLTASQSDTFFWLCQALLKLADPADLSP